MTPQDTAAALQPLGFTELEALVYADLIRRPEQTGYSLAKRLGKGQASIYAALAGLETKQAVDGTDAASRTYAPRDPAALVARSRAEQTARLATAEEALGRLRSEGRDASSLVRLNEPDQIYARALALIEGATETLLFEFTPPHGDRLAAPLSAAAARGVKVGGMVMRAEDAIEGAHNVVSPLAAAVRDAWPFAVLIVVADARQALIAGIGADSQALWSDSVFLSVVLNNALASDILLQGRHDAAWEGPNMELFGRRPPGFADLLDG